MEPQTESYRDDKDIPDCSALWRRIPSDWCVRDDNRGGMRPSSAAFENDRDGKPMSVYVESILRAAGRGESDVLAEAESVVRDKKFFIAAITAGLVREHQQGVALEAANLPGHAVVFGKKTNKVRRALALKASWVVAPSSADS